MRVDVLPVARKVIRGRCLLCLIGCFDDHVRIVTALNIYFQGGTMISGVSSVSREVITFCHLP